VLLIICICGSAAQTKSYNSLWRPPVWCCLCFLLPTWNLPSLSTPTRCVDRIFSTYTRVCTIQIMVSIAYFWRTMANLEAYINTQRASIFRLDGPTSWRIYGRQQVALRLLKNWPSHQKNSPSNLQFVFLPCPFDHRMRHLSLCVDGDSLQRRPAQLFGWARMGPKERTGPTWTGTCIWCLPVMRWVFSLSRGDESEIKHENAPSHLCVYFTSFSTNIYIYTPDPSPSPNPSMLP
jgi:hypothetical protein